MRFHEYETIYGYAIRSGSLPKSTPLNEFYGQMLRSGADTELWSRDRIKLRIHVESKWYSELRPYYKVWPAVIKSLCRLKLDIPMNEMKIRPRVLAARLAHGHEINVDRILLRAILIDAREDAITLACDGLDAESGREISSVPMLFPLSDASTFEKYIADSPARPKLFVKGKYRETEGIGPVVLRIALSLLLLADDPTIIEPDVLSKDAMKYERNKDEKLAEKARRRGKIGWHIGKAFETMPHFRRPHLAVRWMGKGRHERRIRPVKGCVVHTHKMTKVPTGYVTPEGVEVEP